MDSSTHVVLAFALVVVCSAVSVETYVCAVTLEYDPVCDIAGKIYSNPSTADCKGVTPVGLRYCRDPDNLPVQIHHPRPTGPEISDKSPLQIPLCGCIIRPIYWRVCGRKGDRTYLYDSRCLAECFDAIVVPDNECIIAAEVSESDNWSTHVEDTIQQLLAWKNVFSE